MKKEDMKKRLINEVRDMAAQLKTDKITIHKFARTYHHDRRLVWRHFGTWENLKKAAGIESKKITLESTGAELKSHWKDIIVKAMKQKAQTMYDLCDLCHTYPSEIRKILESLNTHPGFLHKVDGGTDLYQIIGTGSMGPENQEVRVHETKFGLIGDTHLGSKFQQLTYLWDFYEYCAKQGIKTVLHAGDMTDGNGYLYRGQQFEMFLHGFREQREYVIENYPKVDGIKTYVIMGNHDESWIKSADINIVEQIAREREDIEYIGRLGAYAFIEKARAYLIHPIGGSAYAQSYKAQKFIESFSSENKPQLFFLGHWHFALQGFLRNIHYMLTGCFQAQTPYELVRGLHPAIGGWILNFDLDKDGYSIKNLETIFRPYYRIIKKDYRRDGSWV